MLALRDYYIEKVMDNPGKQEIINDKWAIGYIDPNRTQLIMEAFDDDSSGFVTVQEANMFTQLRPRDWRSVLCDSHSFVFARLIHCFLACLIG